MRKDSNEFVKAYDFFYGKFTESWIDDNGVAKKEPLYYPTAIHKKAVISDIMDDISWNDSQAIRLYIKYYYSIKKTLESFNEEFNNSIFRVASKESGIHPKKLANQFELARKHMYNPIYIRLAVPSYYDKENHPFTLHNIITNDEYYDIKELTKEDFNGKKYIVTALNRAGFYYKYQLKIHLSNGWYYLWTIPGIGDTAKQCILKAIDRWESEGTW